MTMTAEQAEILGWFTTMLQASSTDGGRKRAAGLKPSWKIDSTHEAAVFSHLNKWKHGEKIDKESGAHPLVHLAWRALAIAWQETHAAGVELAEAAKALHPIEYPLLLPCHFVGCQRVCRDHVELQVHQLGAHGIGNTKPRVPGAKCATLGCPDTSVGGPLCSQCTFVRTAS